MCQMLSVMMNIREKMKLTMVHIILSPRFYDSDESIDRLLFEDAAAQNLSKKYNSACRETTAD